MINYSIYKNIHNEVIRILIINDYQTIEKYVYPHTDYIQLNDNEITPQIIVLSSQLNRDIDYLLLRSILKQWVQQNGYEQFIINNNDDEETRNYKINNLIYLVHYIVIPENVIHMLCQEMDCSIVSIFADYNNNSRRCRQRRYDKVVSYCIATLTTESRYTLIGIMQQNLLDYMYITYGLEGTQYNDISDGIMDFIESTGNFTNNGLASLPLVFLDENMTIEKFVTDVANILKYGIF